VAKSQGEEGAAALVRERRDQVKRSHAGPRPIRSPPTNASPSTTTTLPPQAHELSAADVGTFLDGAVPGLLASASVAGAVVVVAKDGQILSARGYGYADVAARAPVSVDGTLFRPGSISKLFTATAVMQLVEQGKLDLDRNVNDYLDFKIPDTFAQPVTLRHLLTHSAGFEEWYKSRWVRTAGALEPLAFTDVSICPPAFSRPAQLPPIRPMPSHSWATSCSASPASASKTTSQITFSSRSG